MKPLDTLSQCLDALEWEATCKDELDIDLARLKDIHAKLRELTRWIPVEERMPTEADLNDKGYVSTYDAGYVDRATVRNGAVKVWDDGDQSWDDFDSTNREMSFTHWRRIDTP